tara:strand:+ start:245 stop:712 length:468 start_codon:yes stop_codon:yes gene_type:complete
MREDNDQLISLINHFPFPVMLFSESGEVLSINENWERIFGYSIIEIPLAKDWAEIIGTEETDSSIVFKEIPKPQQIINGGEFEIRTKRRGVRYWEFTSATISKSDSVDKIALLSATDITDRRKAERALRISETQFRAFFTSASVGICMNDKEGYL